MNIFLRVLLEVQETTLLAARAFGRLFRRPAYLPEMITQMDVIGVGSLTIILLTGFFTGGVLALQTYPTLKYYGAQDQTGRLVATALVRELGPVLSGLMVAGRVASAIAAELGSMVVSQQIDAMRALGTDPVRKLVAPRLIALLVTLAAAHPDLRRRRHLRRLGGRHAALRHGLRHLHGGGVGRADDRRHHPAASSRRPASRSSSGRSPAGRGCSTEGGTVGVGRSTTTSVVMSSILIIVADFFITKALQVILGVPS